MGALRVGEFTEQSARCGIKRAAIKPLTHREQWGRFTAESLLVMAGSVGTTEGVLALPDSVGRSALLGLHGTSRHWCFKFNPSIKI